jgi:hypothetical protein
MAGGGEAGMSQEAAREVVEQLNTLAARMFEDGQTYWAGKVSDIAKSLPEPTPATSIPAPSAEGEV